MAIFRFRIRSRDARPEPLATQKAAAAWLHGLPRADAIERQRTVTRAIEDAFRSEGELRFEQVGAIEFLDAELATDRDRFITQYVELAEGTHARAHRMWQAAYDGCQGFIVAYRRLLDRAQGAANEPRWTRTLPRLAARLIHFYGTDAELRVLKHEAWIPAKWMDLHRIYKRAVDLRVERAPPGADPSASGALRPTVEQEYVAVLLTHLFNTGTLALREIDWAAAALRSWATGLRLDDVSRTPRRNESKPVSPSSPPVRSRSRCTRNARRAKKWASSSTASTCPPWASVSMGCTCRRRRAPTGARRRRWSSRRPNTLKVTRSF
jgi:hypothetical protein